MSEASQLGLIQVHIFPARVSAIKTRGNVIYAVPNEDAKGTQSIQIELKRKLKEKMEVITASGFDKKVICSSQHSKDLSDIFRDQLTASLQNTSKKFFATSSEHQKEQTFEHSATMLFAIP